VIDSAYFFFVIINQAFNAMFTALTLFSGEKKIINHERRSGMYSVSSYFMAKTMVEVPLQLFFPTLFATIIYWMAGLQREPDKYFIFLAIIELTTFTGESMGLLFSAVFDNFAIANALAPLVLILFLIFSGFYINDASIPPYFVWIKWISFIRYGFQAASINEFEGLKLYCKPKELDSSGICPYTDGQQVIDKYLNFGGTPLIAPIMALLGFTLLFRFVAYVMLRIRKPKQK